MHGGDGEVMVEEVVLSSWLMILEGSYYNIQGGGARNSGKLQRFVVYFWHHNWIVQVNVGQLWRNRCYPQTFFNTYIVI